MVPIISVINLYQRKGVKFTIIEPLREDVKSLFQNYGWFHFIESQKYQYPSQFSNTSLLLQNFRSDEQLNDIVSRAIELCLQQLVFAEGVPQAFEWALNEIAGNILVHSGDQSGWLQVITYPANEKLALIVCDSGVGIPSTMKSAFPKIRSDQEALEMAIRKGVTSKPNYGQGNGLAGSLAIAQGSNGSFAITSGEGRITLLNGKLEHFRHFPPYKGTCVEMQFSTHQEIDLPRALWGHEPVDYIEQRFEDDQGELVFKLREYASSFGNRITGERIRNLVSNLLKQNPGKSIKINMSDIVIISSSFADELFGKLATELGVIDFGRFIKFEEINSTCKGIIDNAVAQRIAQTVGYITPINNNAN